MEKAFGPEMRITERPASPTGVAMAVMVSSIIQARVTTKNEFLVSDAIAYFILRIFSF